VHVQNINTYARDFKDFVNKRLKGVSTKYLEQYAKWFQFHHTVKILVENQIRSGDKVRFNITDQLCKELTTDNIGLDKYRRLETNFQQFLKDNNRTDYGVCKNHYFAKKDNVMKKEKTWEPPSYSTLNADLRNKLIRTEDILMYYREFTMEEGFPGRVGQDLFEKAKKRYKIPEEYTDLKPLFIEQTINLANELKDKKLDIKILREKLEHLFKMILFNLQPPAPSNDKQQEE
jgi:hypothetical protein